MLIPRHRRQLDFCNFHVLVGKGFEVERIVCIRKVLTQDS